MKTKTINTLSAMLLSLSATLACAQDSGTPQAPLGSKPAGPKNPADHEQQIQPAQPDWPQQPDQSEPPKSPPIEQLRLEGNQAEKFVSRFNFATEIRDREPVDRLATVNTKVDKVYFFTELKNLAGETIKHRWIYQGNVISEVDFKIGGPQWRVWSSKNLQPDLLGIWTVEVVNSNGEVIAIDSIDYREEAGFPSEEVPGINLGAITA